MDENNYYLKKSINEIGDEEIVLIDDYVLKMMGMTKPELDIMLKKCFVEDVDYIDLSKKKNKKLLKKINKKEQRNIDRRQKINRKKK